MSDQECFLREYVKCNGSGSGGFVGVKRLRTASLSRADNLHVQLSDDPEGKYWCHKNCVSTYTSKAHIQRHVSKIVPETHDPIPVRRSRRSNEDAFVFKMHCLICGQKCDEPDSKHRSRWRSVSICRTADRGRSEKTFRQILLDTCDQRNDSWGDQVRMRVQAAISDLHAADAMYHRDCLQTFKSLRHMDSAQSATDSDEDVAFVKVVDSMTSDKSKIWNAVELDEIYRSHGGTLLSRRPLVAKLSDELGPDLLVLSGVGVANILVFRNQASKHLKLVRDDEDDIDQAIQKLSNVVVKESEQLKQNNSTYDTRIDLEDALATCSLTLLRFLSRVSSKLDGTLPAAMIGNMITSVVTKKSTLLQIALGVVIREKINIELLHGLGITSSYDEVLRFKSSAANAACNDIENLGILRENGGLIQAVADNFDAQISSANGTKTTHALALLITQPQPDQTSLQEGNTIKRLKKTEMSSNFTDDVVHEYVGPKKPAMPSWAASHSPLPLYILASQTISAGRAGYEDLQFFKDIVSQPNTPEYGGYNTRRAREQDHSVKEKTKAIYLPLIDMVPTEPTTMMTAMLKAQKLTNSTGQMYTIFTNDQQLYRIAVNITWVYSDVFLKFIPRLGGMHTLMSFVGAVGTLMADTGLQPIMEVAFGGVAKMLAGKKFPQNVRALRMVVQELLRDILTSEDLHSHSQLMHVLEEKSQRSRTSKLWVDNLIKPVLIMMLFIRAEREADWPLHLLATKMMMPYFFASGHFNYARYCLYYLRCMSRLPRPVEEEFIKGHHVMRHQSGIWNGLWSDLFIESTFMRYGHSPGGLVGITLQPSTVRRWALSLHLCAQLRRDVMSLSDPGKQTVVTSHKEEGNSRILSDAADREKIKNKLTSCTDPLNPENHKSDSLVNIVTGRIASSSVNVDRSVELGEQLMRGYEDGWPESFHKALTRPVATMAEQSKRVNINGVPVCDPSLIYSRVLCLQKVRDINMKDVLGYELSYAPPSMFEKTGDMRISKAKSALKTKLQVELTARHSTPPEATVLDGCAILWVIRWPAHGVVRDFVENVFQYTVNHLKVCDTYLIFDRYYDNSIKENTRASRAGQHASREHQLSMQTPLPPQKVCLTVTRNKVQLIKLVRDYFTQMKHLLPRNGKSLVITGPDPVPIQICAAAEVERIDLRTTHEEADVIIVQQVVHLASRGITSIRVIADDTDVFVLLLHFYMANQLTIDLVMVGTSPGKKVVDIKATAEKHGHTIDDILPAHVLSGCDTVAALWGMGKGTVLKVVKDRRKRLDKLGDITENIENVRSQATSFIASCYGHPRESNMTALRYEVWLKKMSNHKLNAAPDLKVLPPTSEAFEQHVLRAHFQAAIWRNALDPEPPSLSPLQYGWKKTQTNVLEPICLPQNVTAAPEEVLQMIKCSCDTCSTARCSCRVASTSCSEYCGCQASSDCMNPQTRFIRSTPEDDEEYDESNVE